MSLLVRVPDLVMGCVCSHWIGLKDLGQLDSACSSHQDRSALLKCLRDPQLNFSTFVPRLNGWQHLLQINLCTLSFLKWTSLRECETTRFPHVTMDELSMLALGHTYPHVLSLAVKSLGGSGGVLSASVVRRALELFPGVTKLAIARTDQPGIQALTTAASLIKLESLTLPLSACANLEVIGLLTSYRETLREFLYGTPVSIAVYEYICKHCPQMTSMAISLENHTTKNSLLSLLVSSCERFETIIFTSVPFVLTDADIIDFSAHLPNLIEFRYPQLRDLPAPSMSSILILLRNCPNLKVIQTSGFTWTYLSSGENFALNGRHSLTVAPTGGSQMIFNTDVGSFASKAELQEFFGLVPPCYGVTVNNLSHDVAGRLFPLLELSTTLNYFCFTGRGLLVANRLMDVMKTCTSVKLVACSNQTLFSIIDKGSFREFIKSIVETLCEVGQQSLECLYFHGFYQMTNSDLQQLVKALAALKSVHFEVTLKPLFDSTRALFRKRNIRIVETVDQRIFH